MHSKKPKKQTQEINAPHKPKPKYRTPKNEQRGQRLNEIQALSMVEDSNGGEGVGRKKKILSHFKRDI